MYGLVFGPKNGDLGARRNDSVSQCAIILGRTEQWPVDKSLEQAGGLGLVILNESASFD